MATKVREDVATDLQTTVVELVDLSLQGKQAHWMVTGPNFLPVHRQLDEIVDDVRTWGDDVAERAVAIGAQVDGRAATVARDSSIEPFPEGAVEDQEVVRLFTDRLALVAGHLRERIDRLGEPDPISQDLLIGIAAGLEKHLWMLRVQVR